MTSLRTAFSYFIVGLIGFGFTAQVLADGVYIPEKAYVDYAKIPSQKALISFRDGEETLIIESAVDTASPNLAWVVPLPAAPTEIKKVTPGTLKTLSFCIQPEIIHDFHLFGPLLFLVLSLIIWFKFLSGYTIEGLLYVSLILVFLGLLMPALGGGSRSVTTDPSGVEVIQQTEVGSYEISSLKADNPQVLNDWLVANEFTPLNQEAQTITADYIKNDWVFCVAKLLRKDGGLSVPHPLLFKFPCDKPVYPMKLTALAKSEPYFEIFVVADRQVSSPLLQTEFADRYLSVNYAPDKSSAYTLPYYCKGQTYGQDLGHPNIIPHLWTDCILTKLSGTIAPKNMADDLYFDFTRRTEPYRQLLFSRQGALYSVITIFCAGLPLLLIIAGIMKFKELKINKEERRKYYLKTMPKIIVSLIICCLLMYAAWPTEEFRIQGSRFYFNMFNFTGSVWKNSKLIPVAQTLGIKPSMEKKQIEELLLTKLNKEPLEKGYDPPHNYFGERIILEDSPGNFLIKFKDDLPYICYFDRIGGERWIKTIPDN
ncbi:MAG: DUF2330 domain-containing protein [Planctomycetes bacterium]|nr:DUF2330 domain-containing protein [Planctomycetota bacterium]